jgi:hypothetical protein
VTVVSAVVNAGLGLAAMVLAALVPVMVVTVMMVLAVVIPVAVLLMVAGGVVGAVGCQSRAGAAER